MNMRAARVAHMGRAPTVWDGGTAATVRFWREAISACLPLCLSLSLHIHVLSILELRQSNKAKHIKGQSYIKE